MIKYIVYVVRYEERIKNTITNTDLLNQFFCILYRDPVVGPVTFYRDLFNNKLWWVGKRITENLVKKLLKENCLLRLGKFTNSRITDVHELQGERILGAKTVEERKRLLEEIDVSKETDKLIYYQEL